MDESRRRKVEDEEENKGVGRSKKPEGTVDAQEKLALTSDSSG
jgi:hypothetical protein